MKKLLFAVATIAAGLVFADFSPDTLAFYPFTDGAAGDSANGVTLKNAVAPGTNDAVSVQYDYPSTAAKGVIRFDDDVPGSYLFDDVTLALPDPVCSHLRSILITTDVTDASQAPDSYAGRSGGYISLPDISTELSKCGTSGFTVEFFWKIPTEEPYPCTWAAALTLDVGITDAGGTNRKVSVAFPVGGPDVAHGRYLSVFTSPWGSYADYGAPISYGEWHHLALTFTSGVFKVVGDYTATASISGLTVSEIQMAKEIKLGMRYDNAFAGFHGKIAGLRFSKRPLAVSEYLKASDRSRYRNVREPDLLTVDTNTVAFYSFKEGAGRVGEQTGDAVMLNDVSNNYPGVSAKAGGVFPAYSDDAPGPYVFVGYGRDKTAFCTNAMSLSFGGGKVDFEGIGTALSELDESTIEFFWKMAPDEAIVGWKATMAWDGGYLRNGASYPLSLIIPLADQTSQFGREIRLVRQGKVSEYDGFIIVRTYADLPEDGLWHHIAVTYKNGEVGLYADYSKVGAVGGFTRAELAGSVPFQLGLGNYRGKIACLRVSKKALDPSGMIYASSDPSCYPSKTLIRLRLDGTVGANADSTNLPNIAPSYTDVNPGIFAYGTQSFPAIDRANGSTAGPAGVFPVFSASK